MDLVLFARCIVGEIHPRLTQGDGIDLDRVARVGAGCRDTGIALGHAAQLMRVMRAGAGRSHGVRAFR